MCVDTVSGIVWTRKCVRILFVVLCRHLIHVCEYCLVLYGYRCVPISCGSLPCGCTCQYVTTVCGTVWIYMYVNTVCNTVWIYMCVNTVVLCGCTCVSIPFVVLCGCTSVSIPFVVLRGCEYCVDVNTYEYSLCGQCGYKCV